MDSGAHSKMTDQARAQTQSVSLLSVVQSQGAQLTQLASVVEGLGVHLNRLNTDTDSAFSAVQKEITGLRSSSQGTAATLSTISDQLNALTLAITSNAAHQHAGSANPPVAPTVGLDPALVPLPPESRREPLLPSPKVFEGDLSKCRGFVAQCEFMFLHQPSRYSTDEARVALIVSLLGGRALDWAVAILSKHSSLASDFARFITEFRLVFDHPADGSDLTTRLHSLSQGTRSVAEYAVEFRILAAGGHWNDEALMSAFRRGLSDSIKDLILRDRPTSLDTLIALALQVDDRLRERRLERSHRTPSFPKSTRFLTQEKPQAPFQSSVSSSVQPKELEPMQLGRSRLTREVRAHRVQNRLCLYCGESGHFIQACEARPKDLAR